jgi:hypothetical protein
LYTDDYHYKVYKWAVIRGQAVPDYLNVVVKEVEHLEEVLVAAMSTHWDPMPALPCTSFIMRHRKLVQ